MIPFILYGSMVVGAKVLNIENQFSISNVSLESVGLGLGQYVIAVLFWSLQVWWSF